MFLKPIIYLIIIFALCIYFFLDELNDQNSFNIDHVEIMKLAIV
ncbi:hypothetical protein OAJ21_02880 [Pelagibacteraceae bacterium]|nr:hypothetical protein [Pelagibacteraceae bacterium]